jgi:hypothetical protein
VANGKAKGSAFEREISKFLTTYMSGQEKDLWYWRSPGSGMMAKLSNQKGMTGDILPLKEEAKALTNIWSIEAKNGYVTAEILNHLKSTKNEIIQTFWKQCVDDAIVGCKSGMLIFKRKGCKPVVGIEGRVFDQIKHLKLPKYVLIHYDNELPDLIFFDMEEFFTTIKPEFLSKIVI